MKSLVGAFAVTCALGVSRPALAQHALAQHAPAPVAAIDGTVVDSAGHGLAGVDVVVMDSKRTVRTSSTGAYWIDSIAPGTHILRFRRLGLQPVTLTIDVAENDVTGVDVVMPRYVHQLETVEVQGENGNVYYIPKAFVERMHGNGTYLTEADVEKRHAINTGDLFRGIPGLEVDEYGKSVHGTRGAVSINGTSCADIPIYINDSYASGTPGHGTQASTAEGEQTSATKVGINMQGVSSLDAVNPTNVVGVEIYRGPSEMPAALPPSPCGAIVIWTK